LFYDPKVQIYFLRGRGPPTPKNFEKILEHRGYQGGLKFQIWCLSSKPFGRNRDFKSFRFWSISPLGGAVGLRKKILILGLIVLYKFPKLHPSSFHTADARAVFSLSQMLRG
jgi:hypothetical protein